jgi:hypothetical protein
MSYSPGFLRGWDARLTAMDKNSIYRVGFASLRLSHAS